MNPSLKHFLIIFIIAIVVHFPLFYLFEEDRDCIFDWGTKCSNSYFVRTGFQSIFMTFLLYYLNHKRKSDKQ